MGGGRGGKSKNTTFRENRKPENIEPTGSFVSVHCSCACAEVCNDKTRSDPVPIMTRAIITQIITQVILTVLSNLLARPVLLSPGMASRAMTATKSGR